MCWCFPICTYLPTISFSTCHSIALDTIIQIILKVPPKIFNFKHNILFYSYLLWKFRSCSSFSRVQAFTILNPAETCDILKGFVIICCVYLMNNVDTSMIYHIIKSQSVIKLYIFFNMLEVRNRSNLK